MFLLLIVARFGPLCFFLIIWTFLLLFHFFFLFMLLLAIFCSFLLKKTSLHFFLNSASLSAYCHLFCFFCTQYFTVSFYFFFFRSLLYFAAFSDRRLFKFNYQFSLETFSSWFQLFQQKWFSNNHSLHFHRKSHFSSFHYIYIFLLECRKCGDGKGWDVSSKREQNNVASCFNCHLAAALRMDSKHMWKGDVSLK